MEDKEQKIGVQESNTTSQINKQQSNDTFKTPKKKSRLIIVLISLVVVLIGTTGLLVYQNMQLKKQLIEMQSSQTQEISDKSDTPTSSPTPDPTANWQIYENDKYSFSFKYPNDYYLSDKPLEILGEDSAINKGLFIIKEINRDVGQPPTISLYVVQTDKSSKEFLNHNYQISLESWEEFWKDKGFDAPYIISEEEVENNGIEALKVERQGVASSPHSKEISYLVNKDDLIYMLSVRYGTYDPDSGVDGTDEKNALDLIFSTFQFTDEDQANETENWETYIDQEHKISFKYPSNWVYEKYEISGRTGHNGLLQLKPENYGSNVKGLMPVKVSYWDNPEGLTIQNYDQKINADSAMRYPLYNNEAEIVKIDNISAYYESEGDCAPFMCYKYVVSNQNKIWEIVSQYAQDPNEFKQIFDRIIQTIEFID